MNIKTIEILKKAEADNRNFSDAIYALDFAVKESKKIDSKDKIIVLRKIFYDDWRFDGILNKSLSKDYLSYSLKNDIKKRYQVILINGKRVDIGHIFCGLDAYFNEPKNILLKYAPIHFVTFMGDLANVVEIVLNSTFSNSNLNSIKYELTIQDNFGSFEISDNEPISGVASVSDMRGNIDAIDIIKHFKRGIYKNNNYVLENLVNYYLIEKKDKFRFNKFCEYLGLGKISQLQYNDGILLERFENEDKVKEILLTELINTTVIFAQIPNINPTFISTCRNVIYIFLEKLRNAVIYEQIQNKIFPLKKSFYYRVRLSETLGSISNRFYGNLLHYRIIKNANKDIFSDSINEDFINPETILFIPF